LGHPVYQSANHNHATSVQCETAEKNFQLKKTRFWSHFYVYTVPLQSQR